MNRIRRIITGIVALLCSMVAYGQQSGNGDTSLLWQITGKGLAKPSYLFGTIHLICPADYVWTSAMQRTLDKSEQLCLEINMGDNAALMAEGMGLMIDPSHQLSEYFTPEQYKKLVKYAKDSLDMDKSIIAFMRPVTVLMLMTKQSSSVCDAPVSYEEKILADVKKAGKQTMGLETVAEQFKALEAIPVDSVVKYVMESVEDTGIADGQEEYTKLIAAYKKQDIASLQVMITQSEGLGGATDALLNDRNKKWIDRMAVMMKGSSVFFAVGAGHLAGPGGVIALLRKAGYSVVSVK